MKKIVFFFLLCNFLLTACSKNNDSELVKELADAWETNLSYSSGYLAVDQINNSKERSPSDGDILHMAFVFDFQQQPDGFIEYNSYVTFSGTDGSTVRTMKRNQKENSQAYWYDSTLNSYTAPIPINPIASRHFASWPEFYLLCGCWIYVGHDFDPDYISSIEKRIEADYTVYSVVFTKKYFEIDMDEAGFVFPTQRTSLESDFWVNNNTNTIDSIRSVRGVITTENGKEYPGTEMQNVIFAYPIEP